MSTEQVGGREVDAHDQSNYELLSWIAEDCGNEGAERVLLRRYERLFAYARDFVNAYRASDKEWSDSAYLRLRDYLEKRGYAGAPTDPEQEPFHD